MYERRREQGKGKKKKQVWISDMHRDDSEDDKNAT